jgi:hypothetical protein
MGVEMFSTPEGYGAAAFVLIICFFVLRWTNKHQNDWLDDCQTELDNVKLQLRWADWRNEVLARACRRAGVDVPLEIFMNIPSKGEEPPIIQ